jgi:hypothetical protein
MNNLGDPSEERRILGGGESGLPSAHPAPEAGVAGETGRTEEATPSLAPVTPSGGMVEQGDAATPEQSATPTTLSAPSIQATLAGIQFKADEPDLSSGIVERTPAIIKSRVGDLPVGLALPAAALSFGFAFVLLAILLPIDQTEGRRPLLALESVAGGLAPNAGFLFALAVLVVGFASQLVAYPVLARRGRRPVWVLLLIAIGAFEIAGFSIARRSGLSVPGNALNSIPLVLGMMGGLVTGVDGVILGFMSLERDGIRCRECRVILTRESGFCPDCGAWLAEVTPTRSKVTNGWNSGLLRGASTVAVAVFGVGALVLLVLVSSPSA